MKDIYINLREEAASKVNSLQKKINRFAIGRLLAFMTFASGGYFYYLDRIEGVWLMGLSLLAYLFLLKRQDQLKTTHRLQVELVSINEREVAFFDGNISGATSGKEYLPENHAFATDLDLFGDQSLFQYINRGSTKLGQQHLALALLNSGSNITETAKTQESVLELKSQIKWRQLLHAQGAVQAHIDDAIQQIRSWKTIAIVDRRNRTKVLAYLTPILLIIDACLYGILGNALFENLLWLFLIINLGLTGAQMKAIKRELVVSAGISKSLDQCVQIFNHISQADFKSERLLSLKNQIGDEPIKAVKELSTIMSRLESVQNGFGVLFMSGSIQYHVHALLALNDWKEKYGARADQWFDVIGEMEALSSLAQFGFNNNNYVFPEFNSEGKLSFEEVGHPLLSSEERVTNSIDFKDGRLVILTGSNMSGKSTFLRTLGINMVLAKCGAPVCAKAMNIEPIPMFVHMKISDSLAGGQSYFFAEVERLRFIKTELEKGPGFVLLDEILRGTNSEDKQIGTMEFLKKLNELNAIGIVATHDLGVCDLANTFPGTMTNKRFEVEMEGEELHFDYKLRNGICENKNASVILRKSGII
jgi:ABC-type multidrug transport system fused ATPase/permease subunit